jgi:hypothetical protein
MPRAIFLLGLLLTPLAANSQSQVRVAALIYGRDGGSEETIRFSPLDNSAYSTSAINAPGISAGSLAIPSATSSNRSTL